MTALLIIWAVVGTLAIALLVWGAVQLWWLLAEKLVPRGLLPHPDDLETLTDLTRLVLGRGAS